MTMPQIREGSRQGRKPLSFCEIFHPLDSCYFLLIMSSSYAVTTIISQSDILWNAEATHVFSDQMTIEGCSVDKGLRQDSEVYCHPYQVKANYALSSLLGEVREKVFTRSSVA